MGGHNPKSKIVAILCEGLHDQVDNSTKYGDKAYFDHNQRLVYILWENTKTGPGKTLIHRYVDTGEVVGEVSGTIEQPSGDAVENGPADSAHLSDHPLEGGEHANRETPTGMHGEAMQQGGRSRTPRG